MALEQELGRGPLLPSPGDGDPDLAAARLGVWLSEALCEERLFLALQLEGRHRALAEELRAQLLHNQIQFQAFGCGRSMTQQAEAAPPPFGADTAPQPPASQLPTPQLSASQASQPPTPLSVVTSPQPLVQPPPPLLEAGASSVASPIRRKQSFSESVAASVTGGSLGALLDNPPSTRSVSKQEIPVGTPPSNGLWDFHISWVVESPVFDRTFSLLIIMSTVVHAFEVQYQGVKLFNGLLSGTPNYESSDEHFCQDCESVFVGFDWMFGLAFFFEMMIKVVCMRWRFCRSGWNWVDALINCMWLINHLGSRLSLNPTVFRLLRIIRLVRLVRLGKLVSVMQMFDSLHLLMSSIRAGWSVLLWSTVLLVGVMLIAALSLNKLLVGFMSDESEDIDARLRVFRYFGDFTKAMLTMFEITLGNWVPVCRTIVEDVNEWYGFLFICYELVVGFAMVKVITGVFMQQVFSVVSSDDDLLILMRERQVAQYVRRMQSFFAIKDRDHNGSFSWEEFQSIISDDRSKVWLGGMGLDVHDVRLTFELLDNGDGSLTTEELVRGFSRLRGEARSIDVISLLRNTRRVEKLVGQVGDHVRDLQLSSLRSAAAQRYGQSVEAALPPLSIAQMPTRHRGELFVGSCTEGVSDERLPCVLQDAKTLQPLQNEFVNGT